MVKRAVSSNLSIWEACAVVGLVGIMALAALSCIDPQEVADIKTSVQRLEGQCLENQPTDGMMKSGDITIAGKKCVVYCPRPTRSPW